MANNNPSKIPNSLRNASVEFPYVAESVDIYDKNSDKSQEQINADTYRKGETYSKEETNNIISRTPETDVVVLDVPEGSTAADVLDEVPVADRPNKLFRLRNDDNTHYDEYGWTGIQWALLASKDYGIALEYPKVFEQPTNNISSQALFNELKDVKKIWNGMLVPGAINFDAANLIDTDSPIEDNAVYVIPINGNEVVVISGFVTTFYYTFAKSFNYPNYELANENTLNVYSANPVTGVGGGTNQFFNIVFDFTNDKVYGSVVYNADDEHLPKDGHLSGTKYLILTKCRVSSNRIPTFLKIGGRNMFAEDVDTEEINPASNDTPTSLAVYNAIKEVTPILVSQEVQGILPREYDGTISTSSSNPELAGKTLVIPLNGTETIDLIGHPTHTTYYFLAETFDYPYYFKEGMRKFDPETDDPSDIPIEARGRIQLPSGGKVEGMLADGAKYLLIVTEMINNNQEVLDRTPKSIKIDGIEYSKDYNIRSDIEDRVTNEKFNSIVGEGLIGNPEFVVKHTYPSGEGLGYVDNFNVAKGETVEYHLTFRSSEDRDKYSNPIYDSSNDYLKWGYNNNPSYIDPNSPEFAERDILGGIIFNARKVAYSSFYPDGYYRNSEGEPEYPATGEHPKKQEAMHANPAHILFAVRADADHVKKVYSGSFTAPVDCIVSAKGFIYESGSYPSDKSYIRIHKTITDYIKPESDSVGRLKDLSVLSPTPVLSNRRLDTVAVQLYWETETKVVDEQEITVYKTRLRIKGTDPEETTVYLTKLDQPEGKAWGLVFKTELDDGETLNNVSGYLATIDNVSTYPPYGLKWAAKLIDGERADLPDPINSAITYTSIITVRDRLYYMYYQGQFADGTLANDDYGQNFAWSEDGFTWNRNNHPVGLVDPTPVDVHNPDLNILFPLGTQYRYNVYPIAKDTTNNTTDYCIEVLEQEGMPREFVEACAVKVQDTEYPFRFIGNKSFNYIKIRVKNAEADIDDVIAVIESIKGAIPNRNIQRPKNEAGGETEAVALVLNFYTDLIRYFHYGDSDSIGTHQYVNWWLLRNYNGNYTGISHWKKMYMFKSVDGIHWGPYDDDAEGFSGVLVSDLAYDSQYSVIPCGDILKVYMRRWDYIQPTPKKRCIGIMFIDLKGNIITPSTKLFGNGMYTSAASKIDERRELLVPTRWDTDNDLSEYLYYIVDGNEVHEGKTNIDEVMREGYEELSRKDYAWGVVNPGLILKDGDQYITYNHINQSHDGHYRPNGFPVKTEVRILPIVWDQKGSSNKYLTKPEEINI